MGTVAETFIHGTDPEIRDKIITDKAPLTRTRETKQIVTETINSKTQRATIPK